MGTHLPGPDMDHAGNPTCGQDFMAGTICSLPPGHSGPHEATCQVCGGDWYMQECTCITYCEACNGYLDENGLCDDLDCADCGYDQDGNLLNPPVGDDEVAQAVRSIVADAPK